jgi:soluble lytic murein transglycosylase-like protein
VMRRRLAAVAGVVVLGLVTGCSDAGSPEEPAGRSSAPGSAGSAGSAGAAESGPGTATADAEGFDPQTPASGPRDLARRVAAAEDAVRGPGTGAEDAAAAGFALQVLYRQLGRRPRWDDRVLREVPRRYRATVRAHVGARRDLRSMHTSLSATLPAWRIVEPAPAAELRRHYREGQRRFGVPWEVLAAINLVETGMGRIRGTSVAGAQGPMQFIPETWARFGRGDIDDPRDAILAAARYLAHNGGGSGRLDTALYRYNNHPAYVRAVRAYASVIEADARAYRGLYHWRIIYLSDIGDVWLPVGYEHTEPIRARRYVREHPEHRLSTETR